jgi:hypothetical protein
LRVCRIDLRRAEHDRVRMTLRGREQLLEPVRLRGGILRAPLSPPRARPGLRRRGSTDGSLG